MPRRTVGAALVVGLVLALAPVLAVPPAAAAEPLTGTFTLDRMDLVTVRPPGDVRTHEQPGQDVYADVDVQPATPATGVRLVHPGGTELTFAPPGGDDRFVPGTTFPVGRTQTATAGVFSAVEFCGTGTGSSGAGTATVSAATYAEGVLTELAADVSWACATDGAWENVRSAIRIGSSAPYPLVRAGLVGEPPVAGLGANVPLTVRVDNVGTTTATLGTPTLDLTTAGSYALADDGCGSRTLAPGEGCDVGVVFTPASYGTNGWLGGLLWVPVDGYPRAAGVAARLGGRAVPMPTPPATVEAVHGDGGIVVLTSGHPWHGGTTSYELARRAAPGEPWETVGTRAVGPAETGYLGFTDTTVPPDTPVEYAVRGHGPLGTGDYTAPVAATRLASQVAGDVDAVVFDGDGTHPGPRVLADGVTFAFTPGYLEAATPAGVTASVPRRQFAQPGTVDMPAHHVSGNSQSCTAVGTLTVHTALYDEQGRPAAYSADFAGTCNTRPFFYTVRYRAAQPYRAVTVSEPDGAWYAKVGGAAERTITLTSAGSVPVTFGVASLTGASAAEYAVVTNGCLDRTLARGESCDVTVRATPAATGERVAQLAVAADTTRGAKHVWLRARGATAPLAPYPLSDHRVVGRVRLAWEPTGQDGGAPMTGYRVYRAANGGAWSLRGTVAHVPEPTTLTFDDTMTPGVKYAYAVSAVNVVAEGAKRATTAVRAPRREIVFTHFANGFGSIYAQNAPGDEGRFNVVTDGKDHYTTAVSPDGRTLVYAAPTANGYGLWRRTFGATESTLLTTMNGDEVDPAFSPDGRTIAFSSFPEGDGDPSVWTIPAAGGRPVRRTGAAADPTWLPDSETLVVVDWGSTLRLLRVTRAGARTAIPGTFNGRDPAVSPDGKWLAFAQWHPHDAHWGLSVAPVTGGTPRYVQANTDDLLEPAWRGDAGRIYFTSVGETASYVSAIGWAPATRGGFSSVGGITSGGRDRNPAVRTLGLHLTSAPHVTGRTARIGFATTLPLPGERTTCSLDGQAPVACTSPFTRTGLAGGTHTLTIRSTVAGEPDTVVAHTWRVDATPPVVKLTGPFAMTLDSAVTGSWTAPGAVSYDVRYRKGVGSGYSAYVYPAAWQRTTATSKRLPVAPGTELCFSVRARDGYGNLSAWSADRCGATAYDDRALAASAGWTRGSDASAYLGTISTAAKAGATLSRTVTARRIWIVYTRCPGCGSFDVTLGGTRLASLRTDGSRVDRVTFAVPYLRSPVTGTLRITTTSGAPVRIDGVAVLR